jgi:hypothetical protein
MDTLKMSLKITILSVLLLALAPAAFADSAVIYNTLPSPLPPNVPSLSFEATGTGEFGGLIQFAGGNPTYFLTSATVGMSDWAYASEMTGYFNGTTVTASGFTVPLTLNLFNVGAGNTVGSLIASDTINAFIPWRPEPSATCIGNPNNVNNAWMASDGNCYNGSMSTVTFNLAYTSVPDTIIYGIAFNTTNYGENPTGVLGPYDSLNFSLATTPPTVGSNVLPSSVYAQTGGSAFGQKTGLVSIPDSGAIQFTGTPEPSSMLLLVTGLAGFAGMLRRRRAKSARS